MPPTHITSYYTFTPLAAEGLAELQKTMLQFGRLRGMRGLTLIATEGINGTVCGTEQAISEWKSYLTANFGDITFKDSTAQKTVFRRWSVKLKPEIVGLKRADIQPKGKRKHISPTEWNAMLKQEDVVVLDARNAFEVAIGQFAGAIHPGIKRFSEFSAYAKTHPVPKDKKVLMYCTGGIRCEKALIAMEKEGYQNVYQLDGGILAYLQQFPNAQFEGECLVFDQRVAVNQKLEPSSRYGICPHCGQPGDVEITCECGKQQKICELCNRESHRRTCSKRCANETLKLAKA